jgi:hypothetical protein
VANGLRWEEEGDTLANLYGQAAPDTPKWCCTNKGSNGYTGAILQNQSESAAREGGSNEALRRTDMSLFKMDSRLRAQLALRKLLAEMQGWSSRRRQQAVLCMDGELQRERQDDDEVADRSSQSTQ